MVLPWNTYPTVHVVYAEHKDSDLVMLGGLFTYTPPLLNTALESKLNAVVLMLQGKHSTSLVMDTYAG
jgi:hypothetical protein